MIQRYGPPGRNSGGPFCIVQRPIEEESFPYRALDKVVFGVCGGLTMNQSLKRFSTVVGKGNLIISLCLREVVLCPAVQRFGIE